MPDYANRIVSDIHLHGPDHWNMRTEEILAMRETMRNPDARAIMLRIAMTYQQLAELDGGCDLKLLKKLSGQYADLLNNDVAG